MSEGITHTAVLDDAFRLVLAGEPATESVRGAIETHWDFARLGGVTRGADRSTVRLLGELRDSGGELSPTEEARLAFVLGWLCHRAADRQMKPVFRALDGDCPRSPRDCSVYHDAFVFREVYQLGRRGPFPADMFADGPERLARSCDVDADAGERLMQVVMRRSLLAIHTLIPDSADAGAWIDRLGESAQKFRVDLDRYGEAIFRPDPDKVRRFLTEGNFYDADEPLLRTAARLRAGEQVSQAAVSAAVASAPVSHYAQAVSRSVGYVRAADGFLRGETSPDDLSERLDIGRPGVDGKSV